MAAARRSCIACRGTHAKQAMLRLIVDNDGEIWPDLAQKLPGRGVYLCMQEGCLAGMSDRRLQPMRAKFTVNFPQWLQVKDRMEQILDRQLTQMFTRLRVKMDVGRDAVMHRLWNNTPLMLLLAADAGDAVVRQIEDAVRKRGQAGHEAIVLHVGSRQWLGEKLGREAVAVVSLDAAGSMSAEAGKLQRFCSWYGQLKAIG